MNNKYFFRLPLSVTPIGILPVKYFIANNNKKQVIAKSSSTRDVFYVRRKVDLMKTAKINAYIMHIFGKIELLSIHAT